MARDAEGRPGTRGVTITVTAVGERPEISGGTSYIYNENVDRDVAIFTARDPEDPTIIPRWSLSGSDAGDFTIGETGVLTFRNTPDYDRPADSNRDNEYRVTIRASDGRYHGTLDITVMVTDENETAPVVTGRDTFSVRENITSTLYTYRAADADRNTVFSWSVAGTDGGDFEISD